MCGIWGILSLEQIKINATELYNKFNKIKHRGPDKSIYITNSNYTIGFHRLSIIDTSINGDQPFSISYYYTNKNGEQMLRTIYVIVNGEIYNYKLLKSVKNNLTIELNNYKYKSNSDCEVIISLFLEIIKDEDYSNNIFENGIEKLLNKLDGEFAFSIYDIHTNVNTNVTNYNLWIGRDRFGIRPLFYSELDETTIIFGSEMKSINNVFNSNKVNVIEPRKWYYFGGNTNDKILIKHSKSYYSIDNIPFNYQLTHLNIEDVYSSIRDLLTKSVISRMQSNREIGCLLSGGLDSSLVSAIAAQELEKSGLKLKTFSIGSKNSPDVIHARIVAEHIGSIHTNINIPVEELVESIKQVIYVTETFDKTTPRASIYQYAISKWISENTNIKVLLIGDGSDELTGGYLYFHKAPNPIEFDLECKRLLNDIHYFDVLRADRGVSSNGLEPRNAYLCHNFVEYYLSVPPELRIPTQHTLTNGKTHTYEKYLLRKSFNETNLLPECVLWRFKEAMSDNMVSETKSLSQVIPEKINNEMTNEYYNDNIEKYNGFVKPNTKESLYYHEIFDEMYPNQNHIIPYYWMPKWVENVTDPSARILNVYKR